ncbi:MAG: membrane protein insertase YidC [Candidatus Kapabacteria bacterium]|jgi:YidC/Oxa1 family membrane protein insertase|nr:membrane protein insertase YidC [Candidatus Kapabacteria bacterium]
MDRKQLIGFLMIGIIIAAYMTWTSINIPPTPPQKNQQQSAAQKNTAQQSASQDAAKQNQQQSSATAKTASSQYSSASTGANPNAPRNTKYGMLYDKHLSGANESIVVENDLLKTRIIAQGGTLRSWRLKEYKSWFGDTVQIIPYKNQFGALGIRFTDKNDDPNATRESNIVDTRELYFALKTPAGSGNYVRIKGNDSVSIVATLAFANGGVIEKTYTFYGNRYHTNLAVRIAGMDGVVDRKYSLLWQNGLQYQEKNSVDESSQAKAWLEQNRTASEIDAGVEPKPVETNGVLDFAAIKSKYFLAAIKPSAELNQETLQTTLTGYKADMPQEGIWEYYDMKIDVPYRSNRVDNFTVYIGPVDYDILKPYGLESAFNFAMQSFLGMQYIARPVGEYFILPLLSFVYKFIISNYGLAIIIFSLVMKLLLHPLTVGQTKTAQKMQLLAPEMEKIKAKYKDDLQKQQQETMALYGQYGINPAGGCLPLLLQIPIFTALYSVFSSDISLRQTPFFGWITDLSVADEILRLPFKLPLLNVDIVSGLAIASGLAMFAQQYATVKDPQQRAMVYMMPVMMTFGFSALPSGLSLYYFMFNILSVAQQYYATHFAKNKLTLEDLKKMPKKEGWLQKRLREAQEAAGQGRSLPGQHNGSASAKDKNRKR